MFVNVACEFALAGPLIDFGHEALIETEDEVPMSCIGWECDIHL